MRINSCLIESLSVNEPEQVFLDLRRMHLGIIFYLPFCHCSCSTYDIKMKLSRLYLDIDVSINNTYMYFYCCQMNLHSMVDISTTPSWNRGILRIRVFFVKEKQLNSQQQIFLTCSNQAFSSTSPVTLLHEMKCPDEVLKMEVQLAAQMLYW